MLLHAYIYHIYAKYDIYIYIYIIYTYKGIQVKKQKLSVKAYI